MGQVPELICIIFHPNFLPYLIIYQKAREKYLNIFTDYFIYEYICFPFSEKKYNFLKTF